MDKACWWAFVKAVTDVLICMKGEELLIRCATISLSRRFFCMEFCHYTSELLFIIISRQ
jgi:hypothetical protein